MNLLSARLRLNRTTPNEKTFELRADIEMAAVTRLALYGPSGSGKTTTLRCLAGLESKKHSTSYITFNGEIWQDEKIFIPAARRRVSYVFQDGRLFPHLSVMGNLNYAAKRAAVRPSRKSIEEMAERFGIIGLLNRKQHSLSGGQQRRVALARALLAAPRLLLLDEPLAGLDEEARAELLEVLEQQLTQLGMAIIYVSHELTEIERLSKRLIMIDNGRTSAGFELANSPLDALPASFAASQSLGSFLRGTVVGYDKNNSLCEITLEGGQRLLLPGKRQVNKQISVRIMARDVSIALAKAQDSSILNILPVTLAEIRTERNSPHVLLGLSLGSSRLVARITLKSMNDLRLAPGMTAWAQIKSIALLSS